MKPTTSSPIAGLFRNSFNVKTPASPAPIIIAFLLFSTKIGLNLSRNKRVTNLTPEIRIMLIIKSSIKIDLGKTRKFFINIWLLTIAMKKTPVEKMFAFNICHKSEVLTYLQSPRYKPK